MSQLIFVHDFNKSCLILTIFSLCTQQQVYNKHIVFKYVACALLREIQKKD